LKVLLADDSNFIITRLTQLLSGQSQVEIVGTVNNGTDALEALRVLKPDLAIVDIQMPGLSGLDVLREIRKVDKRVKFIVFTLFSSELYQLLAMQLGADYYFSNVTDFNKILPAITELLNKSAFA
jgi:DNA-binding NarL/FixJ family response regulator